MLTNEEKLRMFDILKKTCDDYDIPLNNIEDAENFWELIRYGYTHVEREEQAALYRFISTNYPQLFAEMDESYEELKKKYPLAAASGVYDYKKNR